MTYVGVEWYTSLYTYEKGDILEVGMTTGGHIEEGKRGIGFEVDTGDRKWQTSERIIITIGKLNARLVVNETIELMTKGATF